MASSTTTNPPHSANKSAPLGVKIICVLGVIGAIMLFFASFFMMGAGGPFIGFGLLFMLLALLHLVVVYGLWTVEPWGWTWGMVVFAFGAVMDVFQGQIFGLLISIVLIVYLYSKKDYYRKQRR